MIDQATLKSILDYDTDTGLFTWKPRPPGHGMSGWNGRCAGKPAARQLPDGYMRVMHMGRGYLAHRLAWLYVHGEWPTATIDHADGDRRNNRIANLRLADAFQQKANAKLKSTNTSGFKGVSRDPSSNKWRARITHNRIQYRLGAFDSPADAHKAYCAAAHRLFGEFARVA